MTTQKIKQSIETHITMQNKVHDKIQLSSIMFTRVCLLFNFLTIKMILCNKDNKVYHNNLS